MKYQCKDAELLEGMLAKITEKHGSGFKYDHSIGESDEERKELGEWRQDLHWFCKAGRIWALSRGTEVSNSTMRSDGA